MNILNLYAGIGGNRALWGDTHNITAIESKEDIASVYRAHFPNDNVIICDAHQYLLDNFRKFDYIWASPPCPSHSRARFWSSRNSDVTLPIYPDMKLYQEILLLQNYFDGKWDIENVKPFYDPLIRPTIELGRHLFWSSHYIKKIDIKEADIKNGKREDWSKLHGFDLSKFKIDTRKDQIYRNCVHPETGLHILNCALGIQNKDIKQQELFQ